ncbi:cation:dicarboxylate symporter family transporter, partial [Bacillus mycoides]|uniref:cation:dicarboxylate symporter family transporter n=1 Tax=Bacillus mycoides TaxID=1405 RepID=UPI003CC7D495
MPLKPNYPQQPHLFKKILHPLYPILIPILTLILPLTPYRVLPLITKTLPRTHLSPILKLRNFVLPSYLPLILIFIIHLFLIPLSPFNPIQYLEELFPLLTFPFTSPSTPPAIPLNIDPQKQKLPLSQPIPNFPPS